MKTQDAGPMTWRTQVAVLGAGTAGSALAARLVESGKAVLLVEAGPDYGRHGDASWPADLLDAMSLPISHDWGYRGHGAGGQSLSLDRARVMGGCSTHNGCTQTVGWASDYDDWAAQGCPGWSSDALRPLFEKASRQFDLQRWADDEIQPLQERFLRGCADAGIPLRDDLSDLGGGIAAGCAPVNIRAGVRINASFAYLDAVRGSGLLRILPDALVDRIIVTEGRARAAEVIVHGGRVRVEADEFVLCGGAYGSPEILLRSGIGPAHDLRRLGIDLVADLPGVGGNLHDHPAAQLEFALGVDVGREVEEFAARRVLPEEQALVKLRSPHADGPYDLHVYPWIERDDAQSTGWRCVIPIAQLRPRSRGSVRLRSADPGVRAEIDTAFFSDPKGEDLSSVRYGLDWVEGSLLATEFGRALGREISDAAWRREDTDGWIRGTHQHYWHPAGSCRMGAASDPAAVVDHAGRVHGIAGLRVADASVFPTIPRATPALPTVVVGERIAQFMIAGQ